MMADVDAPPALRDGPRVLIGGIVLGLILGLLVGGRLSNLALVRLRLIPVIIAAVILRFGTETLLGQGVPIVETLRLPLLATAFVMLLWWASGRTAPTRA